ncbi:hypothetical protein DFR29_114159 [Tahibacter aquaticus]|uniref:Uncharacterized protein n=1 Tax=Tahibacter aquaticus TaxID=520092 RepID=A0A4R6YQR2_9GAMM|nr:hypothetical protein [Tahibacter aquaticus]TDR40107.1 hypothetical protein DFR29_114159 [Tahibacter aquaticus]
MSPTLRRASASVFRCRIGLGVTLVLAATPGWGAGTALPSSPDAYLEQAARVRQSNDRTWAPAAGQLGNLRHVQITAPDCVVRIVSGSDNRVYPGTQGVTAIERSRVLDADPHEQPAPRDVVLTTDAALACAGPGSCGVSVTPVTQAPAAGRGTTVCFTVQIATAHDLLLGGNGLSVLVDRVHQPALRIAFNPGARQRLWLEAVDLGLLSIGANAPVRAGGNGRVDFLGGSSSNSASAMFLHGLQARHVGITATTIQTQWSIRIGADTQAHYYQPARAPGALAAKYPIEIEGPIERLAVPAGSVDARPLSNPTREAARALRDYVLALAGPAPSLPGADPALPAASAVAAALPPNPRQRVADVVARYLPASIRITEVALWKDGARLEGIAPDATSARNVVRLLSDSGEFTYVVGGGSTPRDGGHAFSTQLYFSCAAPDQPSICPAGDPAAAGAYSERQVRQAVADAFGPTVTLGALRLDGVTIALKAAAPSEAEARAALERLGQVAGLFRTSTSTHSASGAAASEIGATLKLICAVPPRPDGICRPADAAGAR